MIYRLYLYKSVTKVYNIFQLCKKFLIFFIKNLIFFIFCPIFGLFYVIFAHFSQFVRLTGLEPARRETLDPKSSASTNSATGAFFFHFFARFWFICGCKGTQKFLFHQKFTCKFYQCVDSLTEIVISLVYLVIWCNAKFYLLTILVEGRTSREAHGPPVWECRSEGES